MFSMPHFDDIAVEEQNCIEDENCVEEENAIALVSKTDINCCLSF